MKERVGAAVKESSRATSARSFWARLTDWILARFNIPYGYQDERGFHYGQRPRPKSFKALPAKGKPEPVFTDRAAHAIKHPSTLAPDPAAATEAGETTMSSRQ